MLQCTFSLFELPPRQIVKPSISLLKMWLCLPIVVQLVLLRKNLFVFFLKSSSSVELSSSTRPQDKSWKMRIGNLHFKGILI